MLRLEQLLEPLAARTAFVHRGDRDVPFRGLTLRGAAKMRPGQFVVLVDRNWGKRAHRKFGYNGAARVQLVEQAHSAGATGFIADETLKDEPCLADKNCFFVADTEDFVLRLVETIGELSDRSVVAVTGSAGKSTTVAMIDHALRSRPDAPRVYNPPPADNVFTSVVVQLSRIDNFDHSLLEVAGSAFLRFNRRNFAVSPDVAVLTSVSEAHLDYLNDLEGVARQKAHLFDRLPQGGTAVINLDTPHSDLVITHAVGQGCTVVTFGESEAADIRLVAHDPRSRRAVVEVDGERLELTIGAEGRHMALNGLAVIATVRALGIDDWRAAVGSLATFQALAGRGETTTVPLAGGDLTVVDEAYNANPASMRAAVEAVAHRPSPGRRIVVLGDMLELGSDPAAIHRRLAPDLAGLGDIEFHLYGEHMAALATDLIGQVRHWDDVDALTTQICAAVRPGDTVLVKASNGTGLGVVVDALKALAVPPLTPAGEGADPA